MEPKQKFELQPEVVPDGHLYHVWEWVDVNKRSVEETLSDQPPIQADTLNAFLRSYPISTLLAIVAAALAGLAMISTYSSKIKLEMRTDRQENLEKLAPAPKDRSALNTPLSMLGVHLIYAACALSSTFYVPGAEMSQAMEVRSQPSPLRSRVLIRP